MATATVKQQPALHRWTKEEYYRMAEAGLFERQRVELVNGEVYEMGAQLSGHAEAVNLVDDALRRIFKRGYRVRIQLPLSLGNDSDPEPDVCVVRGKPREYSDAHPSSALLIVEVSDTSLGFDRTHKARLYAAAGIQDYWILNLVERQLEVHREPQGERYRNVTFHSSRRSVAPLTRPGRLVRVNELLP